MMCVSSTRVPLQYNFLPYVKATSHGYSLATVGVPPTTLPSRLGVPHPGERNLLSNSSSSSSSSSSTSSSSRSSRSSSSEVLVVVAVVIAVVLVEALLSLLSS